MAIKPGWSSPPNERFGFGGGSLNSPFEAVRFGYEVGFMVNIFCVFYIKRKDTRYEDELGSKN